MELGEVTAWMADEVRPLVRSVDRPAYARFLEAMVHYTRQSGERLERAAQGSSGALAAFFARMAREEAGHWRLAEADLAALGGRVEGEAPARVRAFHDGWMTATDPAEWVGALLALEGVGRHLGPDVAAALHRLEIPREAARFVTVHLDVDEDHEAATRAFLPMFGEARLREPAARAGRFWVALHREALEPTSREPVGRSRPDR